MGKDFIILGNINWEKQTDTHEFINGVFLELWKKTRSGYTCKQIKDIASIFEFHDKHLSYPRLVAVNVWKIAKNPPKGGTPASENKIINNEIARRGCFFDIPDKSEIFSLYCPSFFNKYRHEKAPIFIIT